MNHTTQFTYIGSTDITVIIILFYVLGRTSIDNRSRKGWANIICTKYKINVYQIYILLSSARFMFGYEMMTNLREIICSLFENLDMYWK